MMAPFTLEVRELSLPFRAAFEQASGRRVGSEAVFVTVARGGLSGRGEGCPRPYQTGETPAAAAAWIRGVTPRVAAEIDGLEALRAWVDAHAAEIDEHPAAWCAVETALLDLFARERAYSVEALLGVTEQPSRFRYTLAVPMRAPGRLFDVIAAMGLSEFKLKIGHDTAADAAALAELRRRCPGASIRFDANNAFDRDLDRALAHLRALGPELGPIEEPFGAGSVAEMADLARALGVAIVVDESLRTRAELDRLAAAAGVEWIANLKVSRLGGPLRALALVDALRAAGWPIVVGAQAGESSILTRAGLLLARAAGPALVGIEGGVGTLLLGWEPSQPSLHFGPGGWLDLDGFALEPCGWGLRAGPEPEG